MLVPTCIFLARSSIDGGRRDVGTSAGWRLKSTAVGAVGRGRRGRRRGGGARAGAATTPTELAKTAPDYDHLFWLLAGLWPSQSVMAVKCFCFLARSCENYLCENHLNQHECTFL
jgi:hypothetical protein